MPFVVRILTVFTSNLLIPFSRVIRRSQTDVRVSSQSRSFHEVSCSLIVPNYSPLLEFRGHIQISVDTTYFDSRFLAPYWHRGSDIWISFNVGPPHELCAFRFHC